MKSRRDLLRLYILRAVGALWAHLLPALDLGSLPQSPRILCIRPDHLGDLLFLTPTLRWLRSQLSEAHLTALVGPWGQEVLAHNPHLDEVRTLPFPGFARRPKGPIWAPYALLGRAAKQLRSDGFDAALVLRFDHWWGAWLARAAGIRRVIGYDVPSTLPFLTHPVPYMAGRHEVLQNLKLAQALRPSLTSTSGDEPDLAEAMRRLPLEFPIPEAAFGRATALVHGKRNYICIHPGAGAAVKLWPPERWAQVADSLVQGDKGLHVLITGGEEELALAWQVAAHMQAEAQVVAGQTDLPTLAALFARAQLVLGSDSGPLKLAQAVGAPTVQLYGPVDVRAFGPWGEPARCRALVSPLPCVPCQKLDYSPAELSYHRCLEAIPVEAVIEAARELLA